MPGQRYPCKKPPGKQMMRSRGSTSILNELYRTTEVAHASAVGVGMSVSLGSALRDAECKSAMPWLKILVFEGVFHQVC